MKSTMKIDLQKEPPAPDISQQLRDYYLDMLFGVWSSRKIVNQ